MSGTAVRASTLIRTLIVDDHAVVRSGYARYLEEAGGFQIVGEAATAADAYAMYRRLTPDIVIMDVMLPGASGIDASRRILEMDPAARILIFSMYSQPVLMRQALDVGVLGALTKDSAPEVLCEAAMTVARGQKYLGGALARLMIFSQHTPARHLFEQLPPREFEICRLLLNGSTIDEIAQALNLSSKTVANRLSMLRQRLNVSSDIQLVKLAASAGLVPWIKQPGNVQI
ncbi:MAG: response regulator transcription factor [Proteobacteria bacterium]|nr:response regulator transcription factor [Pseudomonadota bacterium]